MSLTKKTCDNMGKDGKPRKIKGKHELIKKSRIDFDINNENKRNCIVNLHKWIQKRGKPPKTHDFQRFFNRNENEHRYKHILTSGTLCVNRQSVITQRYSVIFCAKLAKKSSKYKRYTFFASVTEWKIII